MISQAQLDLMMWAGISMMLFAAFILLLLLLMSVAHLLDDWFKSRRSAACPETRLSATEGLRRVDTRTGASTPVTPITESPKCDDCGGTDWHEGPSGDISTNISCAKCGAWYNIAPMLGYFERLDKPNAQVTK